MKFHLAKCEVEFFVLCPNDLLGLITDLYLLLYTSQECVCNDGSGVGIGNEVDA